ncbi:hypothetical protein ACIQNG_06300 [Streptomyces sp. NPDC091377]|uniref:hypothetical protein n=1 Tax=unclassified Streptomyces TaxID=2593676 RepID=UPI00382CF328
MTDFGSSPEQKKAAANALEQHIEPDTKKAGEHADDRTGAAVTAFGAKDGDGWVTSAALKKAHTTWGEKVGRLGNRLGSDKQALRATNTLFRGTDFGVGLTARQSSNLDGY